MIYTFVLCVLCARVLITFTQFMVDAAVQLWVGFVSMYSYCVILGCVPSAILLIKL